MTAAAFSGMRVLVTGSASHLAQALLPMLCEHASVAHVTGIDLRPTGWQHPKLVARQIDLTRSDPQDWLSGHDAFIHLAWVVLRGHMALARMRAINVEASKHWLSAAAQAGLPRIIHLSSASVYGHGEMLTETAPLTPLPGFCYAEHKTEIEHWLEQRWPSIMRLRPHIILGPHAQPLLHAILRLPVYPVFPDPQPQLQCVHEQDVARAILLALTQPFEGACNLAAPGSFSLRDAIVAHRPHALGIPPGVAAFGLRWLWRLSGIGGETGWFDGAQHSLTLDCSRARDVLDWQPKISIASMLAAP